MVTNPLAMTEFPKSRVTALCPGCVKTWSKIEREKIDPPERATIDLFDVGYDF
jgi:hypothetical protein